MSASPELDYIFNPRSVAVVGSFGENMSFGYMFLKTLLDQGYKGNVYPINLNRSEVLGLKCYPKIRDIPGQLDLVIVAAPAQYALEITKDCLEKNVKACSFFTAGFSETGTEEGSRLEREIVEIARRGNLRIIGPNCMGIYNPQAGLHFCNGLSSVKGNLGIVCQSGGNAIYLSRTSAMRGAAVSKAVSYGNACDINESDLLEYFAMDNETKVIAVYIEGVKDGFHFQNLLKQAAQSKPTIILKGGKTEAGAATATSHTGVLAGSPKIWDALIKQSGAIQVNDMDELIDLSLAFLYMSVPKGRRIGIIGLGGGISVMAADSIYNSNLSLPRLSEDVTKKLQMFPFRAGYIYDNPVDTQSIFSGIDEFRYTVQILSEWDGIDVLILQLPYDIMGMDLDILAESGFTKNIVSEMINCIKAINKPNAIVLHLASSPKTYQISCEEQRLCWESGIPVFLSMDRAAKAINKFIYHHEKRS